MRIYIYYILYYLHTYYYIRFFRSQRSVTLVNGLHCAASRTSDKAGLGLRVSQKDMALTQFGFMGLILLRKKELAIVGTEQDEKSIVHFWRTMGYMLGIQDK